MSARCSVDSGVISRPDRLTVLAFLGDPATEQVLRDGWRSGGQRHGCPPRHGAHGDFRDGEIADAGSADRDIAGEDQPLHALGELSDVVEPGVRVLVIGDTDDVDFIRVYRAAADGSLWMLRINRGRAAPWSTRDLVKTDQTAECLDEPCAVWHDYYWVHGVRKFDPIRVLVSRDGIELRREYGHGTTAQVTALTRRPVSPEEASRPRTCSTGERGRPLWRPPRRGPRARGRISWCGAMTPI